MAINEEQRQLEIAAEVEELARALAHSTRDLPHPRDSYRLLGELGATIDHLAPRTARTTTAKTATAPAAPVRPLTS